MNERTIGARVLIMPGDSLVGAGEGVVAIPAQVASWSPRMRMNKSAWRYCIKAKVAADQHSCVIRRMTRRRPEIF